ncbi:sulfate ABC transporter permease subunit CysW [Govanella unica]|uniref:Sulfate ABC transporter permease subunit CysW n=1 Tax=Govanella unica TaxID=2975056 RepID=A0A9X3TZ04_9PROT|nr:sulfate ABC transporter permease subunit CysW [Govania unica]MDA5194307.1 sulfate ABC transporter permease subunit CysW [Govania unica]
MAHASSVRKVGDTPLVRRLLIGIGLLLTGIFLVAPVALIFMQAFSAGFDTYRDNILHADTLHAIRLTVLVAVVVVPINVLFGICAAWLLTKYSFPGKKLLITLIELPFSISPVIAGVIYLFLYGDQGLLGPWLREHDMQIMFSLPAIFLVSLFVTCPFVARELIPLMQTQGSDEEEAAISLGAGGFITFLKVTLPNIRWALLYGTILCNARVMGEFGAVSVVSGSIRGETNTLPLQIELLYNDYNAVGAFAAASTLTLIAVLTLVLKTIFDRKRQA